MAILSHVSSGVTQSDNHGGVVENVLRGRLLILSRVIWAAVTIVALSLFFVTVFVRWTEVIDPSEETLVGLIDMGLSVQNYAIFYITLEVITRLFFFAAAFTIFWRKPHDWMALFVSLLLMSIGATPEDETTLPSLWYTVSVFLGSFGWTSIWILLYLFPDGRFIPRWTRFIAVIFAAVQILQLFSAFYPNLPFNYDKWPPLAQVGFVLGLFGSCLFAQIYRYYRVSGPTQRQQIKLIIFGFLVVLTVATIFDVLGVLFPDATGPTSSFDLLRHTVLSIILPIIPLSICFAVLRYRLWDIDPIVNRALIYSVVTACVTGIYVFFVTYFGMLFQERNHFLTSILATIAVAVMFQPLRERIQTVINRFMYGERDNPYAVLSRLGQRLEATIAPETILPTIVRTVTETLKLPYAAIAIKQEGDYVITSSSGKPVADCLQLQLFNQGESIGQLILGQRGPGESFGASDRRLFEDLARQAGVAVYAVHLTNELQRSRERLVIAREEERRRLQRDLHDGLGTALAAHSLKAGSARVLIQRNREAADLLMSELENDITLAIEDVRRLVYNLRPPELDQMGLIEAIRGTAARYGSSQEPHVKVKNVNKLMINVKAPEALPSLPAAVEVAAYRIVQEALANVLRHSIANNCCISLCANDVLHVEVSDDGIGLKNDYREGVGMVSMRERVEELGGRLIVEQRQEGGMLIHALLPLPSDKESNVKEGGDKYGNSSCIDCR
jgi:signal transduction histidine kinase